jgi:CDGSH-type Zn-finger protein
MTQPNNAEENVKKIVIQPNGPYRVYGDIPLVRKEQVISEFGEPLTWKKGETLETSSPYELCRCGRSSEKPFCDNTHEEIPFDGTETADTNLTADRQIIYEGGKQIVVKRDFSICMDAGFCATRFANIKKMMPDIGDTNVRSQIIAMIERCPSGSFTYALEGSEGDVEPDLPQEIALITEFTLDGPVTGPLWVTGNIPIERSDGQPFEVRNRVTLCGCGLSHNKPLCDGSHRD